MGAFKNCRTCGSESSSESLGHQPIHWHGFTECGLTDEVLKLLLRAGRGIRLRGLSAADSKAGVGTAGTDEGRRRDEGCTAKPVQFVVISSAGMAHQSATAKRKVQNRWQPLQGAQVCDNVQNTDPMWLIVQTCEKGLVRGWFGRPCKRLRAVELNPRVLHSLLQRFCIGESIAKSRAGLRIGFEL